MNALFSLAAAFQKMVSYPFLRRALVVGLLVSLCAALLGTPLVLKRFSQIGSSLSQVGFAATAVAMALGWAPLPLALPLVVAASLVLLRAEETGRLSGDSSSAIFCASGMAFGVMVLSMTTGMTADVCNYLFGTILSIRAADKTLSVVLCSAVVVLFALFYRRLFAFTFDEAFARACGTNTRFLRALLAVLTAVTVALGMRLMGTMLISSLIVFPPLTAMRVCRRFSSTVLLSAVISLFCFTVGIFLSYTCATPTGASVVMVNLGAFLFAALMGRIVRRDR